MSRPKKRKRLPSNRDVALEIAREYGGRISGDQAIAMARARGAGMSQSTWHSVLKQIGKSVLPRGGAGRAAAAKALAIIPVAKEEVKAHPQTMEEKLLRVLHEMRVVELHFAHGEMDLLQWRKVRLA